MLQTIVRNLELSVNRQRQFIVSVSGGLDSSVLLYLVHQASFTFPLKLQIFHMNFQLRGRESSADEAFVRRMAKRLSIPILVKKVKISGTTQIQEQARALRLKALKALPEGEMIEAHHGDDQVETFLFRLFRGSGLHGLSSMKTKSTREGRLIWRPLLSATKDDLRVFAEANGIEFREDSSNRENKYDRNYIRNEVLPTIQKRFPKAKPAILRTIEQIQEEAPPEVFVETQNDSEWNWNELQGLKASELNRWLHEFFRSKFQVFLSRKQITELSAKIRSGTGFVFNAPKDIILRGRAKSRTVATPKIVILRKRG